MQFRHGFCSRLKVRPASRTLRSTKLPRHCMIKTTSAQYTRLESNKDSNKIKQHRPWEPFQLKPWARHARYLDLLDCRPPLGVWMQQAHDKVLGLKRHVARHVWPRYICAASIRAVCTELSQHDFSRDKLVTGQWLRNRTINTSTVYINVRNKENKIQNHTALQDVLEDALLCFVVERRHPHQEFKQTDPYSPPVDLQTWLRAQKNLEQNKTEKRQQGCYAI